MDPSTTQKHSTSRSWWRLLAGILFVFGATLGLAFYLPLKQSHELLSAELAAAKNETVQLQDALKRTQESLENETAERRGLEDFKAKVGAAEQHFPRLAERFDSEAKKNLEVAFDKKLIEATPLGDGVSVSWMNPALLNWKRTTPSRQGQGLMCPTFTQAAGLGLPKVTVHTFAATDAWQSDIGEAHTNATALSIALAEFIVRFCKAPPENVSVASSLGTEKSPLVRFEFRGAPSTSEVGL